MPMVQTLSESLAGGIVTAVHPALLRPGELQRADDCVYREKDPAIWRAPGRLKLNAVALGSVWTGAATAAKGLAHLAFEQTRQDQLLSYTGSVLAHAALTATSAPTIDPIDLQITATTTSGSATITSAALFGAVLVGWTVLGTGIATGSIVQTVSSTSSIILNRKATADDTVTLTFNPMREVGGPGYIAGTISGTNTFTATSGYPFLADIIGTRVLTPSTQQCHVVTVSGQDGTTGHYNIITLAPVQSNGGTTLAFQTGCVQTFSSDETTDEILDFVQWGGVYFLWNGVGPIQRLNWTGRPTLVAADGNIALDDVLTVRPTGLDPVETAPTVTQVVDATYAWPPSLSPGYFWFLITEIFDPDNNEATAIESAYYGKTTANGPAGTPVAVNIPAITGYGARIAFPARVNNGNSGRISTHWGVYMSDGQQDNFSIPSLASFKRVLKVAITAESGQTVDVHENHLLQTKRPTAAASVGSIPTLTNPTNAEIAYDGQYATAKSGPSTDGSENNAPAESAYTTWGFDASAPYNATIVGIRLALRGHANPTGNAGNTAQWYAYLVSGSKSTQTVLGTFVDKGDRFYYAGGDSDNWSMGLLYTDLSSLEVRIGKLPTGQRERMQLDYLECTIYYVSAALNLNGKPFRVVTYRDQIGDIVNEPAAGRPPSASTGDIYQGSLVTNDLSDETAVRFSLPDELESFPKPYVMRFNTTKRKDRVKFIRTLGLSLLVGLENGIQRVNYLPRETDADFSQALMIHDDVATDHGIPGPLAGVKFSWPGRGTMIAYASYVGPFVTDGITTAPLNMDLDWSNTVKLSALSSCVFRCYPKEKWLVLYYCPAGATHNKNTRALIFSYAQDKVKGGMLLPAVGPLTVSGRSSTEAMLSGSTYLLTGHESTGFVYEEDYGVAQASGYQVHNSSNSLANAPIIPFIRTRRIFPSGVTHDSHLYKAYLLFSSFGSTYTATPTTGGAVAATSTAGSATISSNSAVFTSVLAGMRVRGTGIDDGTIVLSVAGDSKSVVLSRVTNGDTASGVTYTFDDGTIGVTDRGSGIGETVAGMQTQWGSTLKGDLIVFNVDDTRQGLELQIEKVPLTFSTDADGYRYDTATWADLGVNMRLHQVTFVYSDQGMEQNRSTS